MRCCSQNCNCLRCCPPAPPNFLSKIYDLLVDFFKDEVFQSYNNVGAVATTVHSIASKLTSYEVFNTSGVNLYLKFYNKANATAADVPALRFMVPAQGGENLSQLKYPFDTALSIRATTGVADNDNVSPAINDLLINIGYK